MRSLILLVPCSVWNVVRSLLSFLAANIKRITVLLRVMANHPQLRCHLSCEIVLDGTLKIHGTVIVGPRSRLIIPKGCELVFEGDNIILNDVLLAPSDIISIGRGTTLQDGCILLGTIRLGKNCLLAPRVFISSGQHRFRGGNQISPWLPIKLQDYLHPYAPIPIGIGDDSWLGINTVFLPGTFLAHGSVVGANSLVRGTFSHPYRIIAGTPATYIGSRWIDAGNQLMPGEGRST